MKCNFNFAALLVILMLNIVFTQKMVHQYYFENYVTAMIYCVLNLVLFPVAILIYKQDQKKA
ncbi:hypothetical protein M3175_12360 [Robertmurraya korlensis]|uniref:hypothetical protein n=1 Tax=Robertmurraya korlensis TaxID=519977 RepID=UPI00203EF71B|nr:hypothetical protein [Robertmurraya korlensis]MCM3601529.1 hypothetical protein [Robertmurraya korlensis]